MGADLRADAVKRLQATCERDPQIIAAFLGGSLATGLADVARTKLDRSARLL